METDMQAVESFDEYTRHFSKFNTADPCSHFGSYDLNLSHLLSPDRDAPILDFGCGMGYFLLYLRDRGYVRAEGIDVSRSQIDYCHSIGLENAWLAADPISFLESRPNRYQRVFSLDVFEHLPKDQVIPTLRAVHRAMTPGAEFIMRVPNIAAAIGPWVRYQDFTHERSFSDRSARQVVEDAGFEAIQVKANKTHYNRKFLGKMFESAREVLYSTLKLVYFLQAPGTVTPNIFTNDMVVISRKCQSSPTGDLPAQL
jgi:SAM-dependent methyltransferase